MDFRGLWGLDPEVRFLNHGSYGACPRAVLALQAELRARMETQPVQFLGRDLQDLLDQARAKVAAFVGAEPEDLVFVSNATTGVNTFLRSFALSAGDEILVTDHSYNACRNAVNFEAERQGATVAVARVPFPLMSEDEVVAAIVGCVTDRTRLALIDHVTSPTALVFPIERIVQELAARGVETIVDGAHAPGMVEVDIGRLGAAAYTANAPKWRCAPKGAAFLSVRPDLQSRVRPLVISHGANAPPGPRSRFQVEFGWIGTVDPTPWLCLPAAIEYMGGLLPGGWEELRAANRAKALAGRRVVLERLGMDAPCPESMLGSMAAIPLPNDATEDGTIMRGGRLQTALYDQFRVEAPVMSWPASPRRLVRLSAQLYNRPEEYEALAKGLATLLSA